jgi:hypothetical protein
VGVVSPAIRLEQRGLAAARVADATKLALGDRQVDVLQRAERPLVLKVCSTP